MAAEAVTAGTLRRLSRLDAQGHPVLSLYLDLDPSRFPTPRARDTALSALLSSAGADDADSERVRELLRTKPDLVSDAQALAIFSCAETGALETVALPRGVEPMAILDTVAWLEPLAAMLRSMLWHACPATGRRPSSPPYANSPIRTHAARTVSLSEARFDPVPRLRWLPEESDHAPLWRKRRRGRSRHRAVTGDRGGCLDALDCPRPPAARDEHRDAWAHTADQRAGVAGRTVLAKRTAGDLERSIR